VRDVAAFVELEPPAVSALLNAREPSVASTNPVVGLLLHRVSCRAVVVGPFPDQAAARGWWSSSHNRLVENPAMAFVTLRLAGDTA
jgi:hypothetical protein